MHPLLVCLLLVVGLLASLSRQLLLHLVRRARALDTPALLCAMSLLLLLQPGLSVLQHLRAGCEAAQKQFNAR